MLNDDAMVGHILSRRDALRRVTHAGLGMALLGGLSRRGWGATAATQPASALLVSPALTEGPFFVDENLNRSDLVAGSTRPSVMNGQPLLLNFTVCKLVGSDPVPLKNAHVDVWHCDAIGIYSDENKRPNPENTSKQTWLRGYQVTDAAGLANFSTIVPGWYNGRTPHIHFKVRNFSAEGKSTAEFTSQLFFRDEDTDRIYTNSPYNGHGKRTQRNMDDGIYAERETDGSVAGTHLTLGLQTQGKALTSAFTIVLTEQSMHGSHRDGHGPGGPGGPGGPPPDGGFGPPPDGGFGPPPGPPPQ